MPVLTCGCGLGHCFTPEIAEYCLPSELRRNFLSKRVNVVSPSSVSLCEMLPRCQIELSVSILDTS